MAEVHITLRDDGKGAVDLKVEWDPPMSRGDDGEWEEMTDAQAFAMQILTEAAKEMKADVDEREVSDE